MEIMTYSPPTERPIIPPDEELISAATLADKLGMTVADIEAALKGPHPIYHYRIGRGKRRYYTIKLAREWMNDHAKVA